MLPRACKPNNPEIPSFSCTRPSFGGGHEHSIGPLQYAMDAALYGTSYATW